jgi:hypothetical protein
MQSHKMQAQIRGKVPSIQQTYAESIQAFTLDEYMEHDNGSKWYFGISH